MVEMINTFMSQTEDLNKTAGPTLEEQSNSPYKELIIDKQTDNNKELNQDMTQTLEIKE